MKYEEEIRVYKLKFDINIPLAENPNECADIEVGDVVVAIGMEVFVTDRALKNGVMSKAVVNRDIFDANTKFFEKL